MPDARGPMLRKYHIAPPSAYAALPLPGKEAQAFPGVSPGRFTEPVSLEKLAEALPARARPKRRAAWIVHGMGQQVPFETLDGLAEGIMRVAHPVPDADGFAPRVRTVRIGDQTVQRVELDVFEENSRVELHLYEAYWAPVTEGEVKLSDVISFLFSACFRGLLNVFRPFHRAMFDQVVETKIRFRAAAEITLSLLTLASLIVINAVIVASGAAKYGLAGQQFHIADNWVALSATASCLSAVAMAFGLILFLAELSQPAEAAGWIVRIISVAVWMAFYLTLAAIVAGAASLAVFATYSGARLSPSDPTYPQLQAFANLLAAAIVAFTVVVLAFKGILRSVGREMRSAIPYTPFFLLSIGIFLAAFFGPMLIGFGAISLSGFYLGVPGWVSSPFWVWPMLLLVSAVVREVMVQYVGDVAAYVTSQNLDRFNKIRQRIKQIALDSAKAVYLAQEDGEFLYDKIAVVGHSLGSVIAYDTLNALLNADKLSLTELKIASRTCLLETFGSPLDKIAFFFSLQGNEAFHIREQLAAAVQPLITSYEEFRRFPWINVYSPNDIVSGKVELYDLPMKGQPDSTRRLIQRHRVRHFQDPDAIVPLVAHVAYWKNKEVWKKLLAAVTR
jgi:hypothetical protein